MFLKKHHKAWCAPERCLLLLARHPVVSSISILSSITVIGSVILIHIEPKTFQSIGDGLWFTYISLLGIGYGDIVPHSWQGRVAAAPLLLCGIVSVSIFTAIVELFFLRPFLKIGPDNRLLLKEIQKLQETVVSGQAAMQAQIDEQEKVRAQFQVKQDQLYAQLQALVARLEDDGAPRI
ncbi:MAG: hypothetical protein HYX67_06930 [Candidatus Melainabacteria bacterium]|nr:hypothetical protein [Candidatus Melainabacteria bacterium]